MTFSKEEKRLLIELICEEQTNMIMLSTCYSGTENRYVVYGQLRENVKSE